MRAFILLPVFGLMACDPMPTIPETDLPFFGDGYRTVGDQCRRVGEDAFTNQFLDDMADLVGCPEDMENLDVFALDTGGVEVARKDGFVLYSVPRG
ncbi:hypothetical protein SAMN05444003_0680 [Cognatiyoonia sediminum]|uniref:Lipoprotein n=1 Tax=Cognatiyoonia sediminum TaxID=1508389 RepID=A0A1M5M7N1_9RHOB|nr:hypothetical protein [Cognatiyoonia sediminum]SHG73248.1 hypothetical protein SAMN05444003_0680 [Cognatiyoonia sediminum]